MITPIAMYIIAPIFESRLYPTKEAPIALLMDIVLSPILMVGIIKRKVALSSFDSTFWENKGFYAIVAIFMIICLALQRRIEKKNYEKSVFYAPTKIYHDVVCVLIYGCILIVLSLPVIFSAAVGSEYKLTILLSFLNWIISRFIDNIYDRPKRFGHLWHNQYNPIWRKRREQFPANFISYCLTPFIVSDNLPFSSIFSSFTQTS